MMADICMDPNRKIVSSAELELRLQDRGGLSYVFTNGCFDILHRGHAEYLYRARLLGSRLIVGLNSDRQVTLLKGRPRPFITQEDRAYLLASLSCVDYVTIFDAPTPTALIAALQPDIHVKGGDYSLESLPEAAAVRAYGGRVVLLPFLPGHSTSGLVTRIREGV